jgi:hypothetical protein
MTFFPARVMDLPNRNGLVAMSLAGLYEILLRGLVGEADRNSLSYITPEAAYGELKKRTGQDFGYDPEKWRTFIRENSERLQVGPFERI